MNADFRRLLPLSQRVAKDDDSQRIAAAISALWADIQTALQPVIGRRSVSALLWRALQLGAAKYSWLAAIRFASDDAVNLGELTALFAAQPPALAREAGDALFEIFRELLLTLIGATLSDRLLQTTSSTSSRTAPAQHLTPI